MTNAETRGTVRLSKERRQLLSRLCPNMFDQEPEVLVRDGNNWRTDRTGRVFSRQFVIRAHRDGLLTESGKPTERGLLLYQEFLRENSGVANVA